MRGDITVWAVTRKSIVGHLVKPPFPTLPLNGKLPLIWYRFSHEATIPISYRFLREATGRGVQEAAEKNIHLYYKFFLLRSSGQTRF